MDQNRLQQLEVAALHCLQSNNIDQAKRYCQELLASNPKHATANLYLGAIANGTGNYSLAEKLFRKAILANPAMLQAYNNLGVALKEQGKLLEAKKNYLKLIEINPDYAPAHSNLGVIYKELGEIEEAVRCLNRAIELNPNDASSYNSLGAVYRVLHKIDDAILFFQKTIDLVPNFAEAHFNLGNAFFDKENYSMAITSYSQALKYKQNYAEAYRGLGIVLEKSGLYDEAKNAFEAAYKIKPNQANYLFYIAHNQRVRGELEKAFDTYKKVLSLDPNLVNAHSNLLSLMNYQTEHSNQEIFEQHIAWEKHVLANRSKNRPSARRKLDQNHSRIKVAYLSPDFRTHSVSFFFLPLLRSHDKEKFEIYCYYNHSTIDSVTESIKSLAEHWRDIDKLSDLDVVKQIIKDDIDILVDLAGHTGFNRLPVFTYRPAPIQITWLGYPNTTGLSDMDYRLTDLEADPEGAEQYHSESLVRLPHGFLCYQGDESIPYQAEPPCLKKQFITFGSFNNLDKVTDQVVSVWANILHSVPNSKLLLKSKQLCNESCKTKLLSQFEKNGVASERLELKSEVENYKGHLQVYDLVDIALDPFPYNGTTTTFEGLWMGVPLVTLCGDRHATRVGSSILQRVGLQELIADDAKSYIKIATKLATDPASLISLRAEMRTRLMNSDLTNAKQFAHDVECSYLDMIKKAKA